MHRLFYLPLLILLPALATAQTPADAVKTAINQLFTAMRNAESVAIKACFAPDARLQSVSKDKPVQTTPIDEFAGHVGKLPPNAADERIVFEQIHIDGNLASAWTPYRFYFKQQFNHCGVNSFQLVQIDGVWKIQYIIDTRRKDDCEAEGNGK
ncbi:nuclear transport factor 2 family protein [Chitinophaga sp.]|uniref:nuclear transport factor 2 family protein n=1 Tax=Chitinophaga sp. TaxID=1869181 RepID=UPI002F93CAE1